MKRQKAVFTLIELLIVIAIIAILAALLLPALNQARNKSKSIKCVSNIKQLSFTFSNYSMDFNNFQCPTYIQPSLKYWTAFLWDAGYKEFNPAFCWSARKIQYYHCPSELTYASTDPRAGGGTHPADYALNYYTHPMVTATGGWTRAGSLANPSRRLGIMDSWFGRMSAYYLYNDIANSGANFNLRHNNMFNVSFEDGHAGSLKCSEVPISNNAGYAYTWANAPYPW